MALLHVCLEPSLGPGLSLTSVNCNSPVGWAIKGQSWQLLLGPETFNVGCKGLLQPLEVCTHLTASSGQVQVSGSRKELNKGNIRQQLFLPSGEFPLLNSFLLSLAWPGRELFF